MKKIIAHLGFFLVSMLAQAQQPSPGAAVPSLPPGPLLARTSDFSRWIITTKSSNGLTTPSLSLEKKPESSGQVIYTKTGSIVLEEGTLLDGRVQQVWRMGSLQATLRSDGSPPVLSSSSGTQDFDTIDFTKADFAGLDWISKDNYTGVEDCAGVKCLVFKGSIIPMNSVEISQTAMAEERALLEANSKSANPVVIDYRFNSKPYLVPVTAYIDLKTRLPVMLTFSKQNKQQVREYTFQTYPSQMLVLPPIVAKAFSLQEQRMKDLTRPTPRP